MGIGLFAIFCKNDFHRFDNVKCVENKFNLL